MCNDLLAQLAATKVPPVPATLDQQVHQRVNRWLLLLQILDFLLWALPHAACELARATVGLVLYSLKGDFDSRPAGREDERNGA